MKVVFVDLVEIETELRADFLPEVFLEIADLTRIFDQQTHTINDVAFLDLGVLLVLEEVGVGSGEGFLFTCR